MPVKGRFAIVRTDPTAAAGLIIHLGKDEPYLSYIDERSDIRCDNCDAPIGDDGHYDPLPRTYELGIDDD